MRLISANIIHAALQERYNKGKIHKSRYWSHLSVYLDNNKTKSGLFSKAHK